MANKVSEENAGYYSLYWINHCLKKVFANSSMLLAHEDNQFECITLKWWHSVNVCWCRRLASHWVHRAWSVDSLERWVSLLLVFDITGCFCHHLDNSLAVRVTYSTLRVPQPPNPASKASKVSADRRCHNDDCVAQTWWSGQQAHLDMLSKAAFSCLRESPSAPSNPRNPPTARLRLPVCFSNSLMLFSGI